MSEIISIHGELIKRCEVIKLTPEEVTKFKLIKKYPRIGIDDIAVVVTNYSHKNLPSYFCYINGYVLKDYIIDVYLPQIYSVKILDIKETMNFWDWSNRSWLKEHPEITDYQEVSILDEFIDLFKNLNNAILRKYLSEEELISLNYHQCCVEIKDNKATILSFKGAL